MASGCLTVVAPAAEGPHLPESLKPHELTDLGQALFEEAGDALFLFDPDSDQLVDVNPTAQLLSGFSRQEMLCMRATFLFRFEGRGGMNRLKHASQHTGVFHSQDGYFLRTRMEGVWVPVNLTIARLHVHPKTLGLITARDAREQRDALQQMKKIEGEMRRVIASVSDCLWSAAIDATHQWTYRYVSPVIEKITGRPADFFRIGLEHWRRVVHPEDRPAWEKALQRLKAGRSTQEEYRIIRPDGTVRWVRDNVSVSHGDDDKDLRLDGVLTDTTEARKAAEALRESQRALATLMSNLPGMAYRCRNDREWTMEFASEGTLTLTGYQPADLVGNRVTSYAQLIHPDDQAPVWQAVQEAVRRREPYQITYRIRTAAGPHKWVWEQGQGIFAADGSLVALEGFIIDVTERQRAEEALAHERDLLHTLMENIPDHIYFKDRASRFLRVNKAQAHYMGLENPQAAVGKTDRDFFPPDLASAFRADEEHLFNTGYPLINKVERVVGPDGQLDWVLTTKVPFYDRAGTVIGLVGVSMDITEQKQIEEELKQRRAEQQMIFDSVPALIWYKDRDNRIIRLNQPAALSAGKSVAELEGASTYDLYPDHAAQYHADDLEVIRSGQAKRGIIEEHRLASGEQRWMQTDKVPHRNEQGDIVGVVVFAVDITERKRAEESLRQAELKFRSIFENAIEGIYQSAPDGRFLTVNPMLARILLFDSPEELLATVAQENRIFYADSDRRVEFVRLMREQGAVTNFESEIIRRDGSHAWISENARALRDEADALVGYEGTIVDITGRKIAESALAHERALLRSLIDSIPDLIFYKDRTGRYLGCNAAFEKYSGRTEKELVGKTDAELLSRDLADFYKERDRQVLAEGKPRRDEEWLEARDGRSTLVETLQTPFFGPDGQVLGLIGMCRDITERKRLEEQLRQAQKMEAIGQLAGGVAHDFNNLLTAILGNVSLLLGSKPPADPDYELLAASEQAAQRATDLTRQLLGFSRQTMLRLEPANLNASIQEIVAILRRTIDPRIAVAIEPDPELWTVQADPGQINQVLMNLCINARDAMPDGGRLLLQATNVELDAQSGRQQLEARPGEFVRLRVQDTGHGIPPEVKARIFEPFFTTKGPGKGTGLGLAMVYGIVQQHLGWIECYSEVGRGTYFDIYLPRSQQAAVQPKAKAAATSALRGSETILLVDDEAVIRNVGRAILQRQGYQVLLAQDGQEAVEIYQREGHRIHLVILDLTMPRLSGRDTLRQLLQINPAVLVLLSSGYTADSVPEVGKEGVLGFVNKPYRPQDLTQAIRAALDRGKSSPRPEPEQREPENWVI